MGFKEFKKAQPKQEESNFVKEDEKTKSFKDDRFWSFTKDASGNAKAVIRFLPQKDNTKSPFVKTFQHAFQNPVTKRWFIDECPWTIKTSCPVCLYAKEVYDQDKNPSKKTWFIANILVVKDELNPEAEGKVFLYKFGKEIFKRIQEAVTGSEEDEIEPIKVFNISEGHNFRFNVSEKTVPGIKNPVNNYEKCRFETKPSEICEGDEGKQETVYNSLYDLDEFLDPKRFKTTEELKEKLASVLNGKFEPSNKEEPQEKVVSEKKKVDIQDKIDDNKDDDDNDDDFFSSLDNDDDILY